VSASLAGKVCLVTGGTSGIGRATAQGLAARGARVILPSRDLARGQGIAAELAATSGGVVEAVACDLASQASIRACASQLLRKEPRLDVLVNSAGIVSHTRRETQDGLEATFGVTYLGAYLLTRLLLPLLRQSAPARVVNVAGEFHRKTRLDFDDLQLEGGYDLIRAGAQAMLCKIMFSFELARRLEGSGVTVNCLHPGAVRSDLLRSLPWYLRLPAALANPFMQSPAQGARTPLFLACDPSVAETSGVYFAKEKPLEAAPAAHERDVQARLWRVSAELTGLEPDLEAS
jgi:retinol dehydrogenase 14